MTDKEKLEALKKKLEAALFPDENCGFTNEDYWMHVQSWCDNATDMACDTNEFHIQLLDIINED